MVLRGRLAFAPSSLQSSARVAHGFDCLGKSPRRAGARPCMPASNGQTPALRCVPGGAPRVGLASWRSRLASAAAAPRPKLLVKTPSAVWTRAMNVAASGPVAEADTRALRKYGVRRPSAACRGVGFEPVIGLGEATSIPLMRTASMACGRTLAVRLPIDANSGRKA